MVHNRLTKELDSLMKETGVSLNEIHRRTRVDIGQLSKIKNGKQRGGPGTILDILIIGFGITDKEKLFDVLVMWADYNRVAE